MIVQQEKSNFVPVFIQFQIDRKDKVKGNNLQAQLRAQTEKLNLP